ncbi:MAG: cytochrome c oxidase subunit II [Actinomycetota bacterium]|nr:cytochrome c oxidase subunit II [Actinomycetota bacterium]
MRVLLGLVVLAIFTLACAQDAPQDYLNRPDGDIAEKADELWDLTFFIAVVVFFLVEGLLVFTIFRFRAKPGREARQFHGNTKVEIILTAIPAVILAGIAVPTIRTITETAEEPPNSLRVELVAHRFWWEYRYEEEGFVTANELHIPTNRDVILSMESDLIDPVTGQDGVVHSFWPPRLAGKQDVIPGRTTLLRLRADEADTYLGQCGEFCGLGHAYMRLQVIAHPQDEYEEWVSDQLAAAEEPGGGSAAEGAKLFAEGAENGQFENGPACSSCHALDPALTEEGLAPQPAAGPNLAHFASRKTFAGALLENNTENLQRWLESPPLVKPGATMPDLGLTDEQIQDLIAYLQSLE